MTIDPSKSNASPGRLSTPNYSGLLALLHEDERLARGKFESLRKRIVFFFDRRGCYDAEAEADETIDRIARNAALENILDVTAYAFRVAHFRFLEILRERERNPVKPGDLDEILRTHEAALNSADNPSMTDEHALAEIRYGCLDSCLKGLPEEGRNLLLAYYEEEKSAKLALRQELARKWGLSMEALRTRLCRLREKVAACCHNCEKQSRSKAQRI